MATKPTSMMICAIPLPAAPASWAMAGEMKKSSMRSVSPEKVSWVAIEKTITGRQAQKAL